MWAAILRNLSRNELLKNNPCLSIVFMPHYIHCGTIYRDFMLDITVIILTYNEEIHIHRCLENVKQFASKVYVVDCFSTDKTAEIAKESDAEVVEHEWPGNQAEQFNWALDTLKIDTGWILRLDADEYLLPELIEELQEKLPRMPESVSALSLSRARFLRKDTALWDSEQHTDYPNIPERKGKI